MKRFLASGLALTLAVLLVATFARTPAAQTGAQVLKACEVDEQEIEASALPDVVGQAECPVGGRQIVDGPVASVVPPAGEGVYVEALTLEGAQELEIRRLQDGSIELEGVGEESEEAEIGEMLRSTVAARSASDECRDIAYQSNDWRVVDSLGFRINLGSIPQEISLKSAADAIRRAGVNITGTDNGCKMGDRVPADLNYNGNSDAQANVGAATSCTQNDEFNVVSFGDRPSGTLATTCTYFNGGSGEVTGSDIEVNKDDFRWTTRPLARSCKGRFDLEAIMTHERGHTFGLGHVLEKSHRNLTMSNFANGPCQASERSLGRGDVLGLDRKYR